jgi:hypothetical protein
VSVPADRLSLLRPATDYETVAGLLHHQPAAAFTSLFVLYGFGHGLCTHLSVAELAAIEASVRGQGVQRDYRFDRITLRPLQGQDLIDIDPGPLALHCFSGCSIRQFPVFFLAREPGQMAALDAMLPQIVGQATVRYQDWRLENAWEWALLSRAALSGELAPMPGFPLMEALGWRLVRPVTELGGRSPVLEWQLMKVAELEQPGALPLMTVLTDREGTIIRRADAQLLTVFRSPQAKASAPGPTGAPQRVTVAVDRAPLVQVRASAARPEPPAVSGEALSADAGDDYPLAGRASDKVVRLQRLAS